MDAGARPAHRRSGGDLSTHDVRHHGAGSAGICGRQSRARGSAKPVRQSDGGRCCRRAIRVSSSSPASRWCGTRASPPSLWAKPWNLPHDALRRSADWLLTKEVRRKGDWSVKRPKTEPSGWYFEFANEFYPDIDDTAHGAAGAEPLHCVAFRRAAGLRAPRHSMAVRHAVQGWRLGCVRRG